MITCITSIVYPHKFWYSKPNLCWGAKIAS